MEFQGIYEEINWKEMETQLESLFPQWEWSFSQMIKEVYMENGEGLIEVIVKNVQKLFLGEYVQVKQVALTIVVVILVSAIFVTFKDAFQNHQIAEISFYINYLILIILFIHLFSETLQLGEEALKKIEQFMRIFFPTFALVLGTSAGSATGVLYYQLSGIVIYLVEKCLLSIVLPGISIFMLYTIMNGIWEEEKLSLMLDFIKKSLKFVLKIILGILTGTSLMQSLITPVIERVKGETIYQAVESIPGLGDFTEGAMRIGLGSAVIIKNSIGIVGCIFLLLVSLAPLIRIFIMGSMLKLMAAVLSLVGDKKMIKCTSQVGDGIFLVLQTVGYGVLFFVVLIAIAAYTTNGGI